MKKVIYSSYTKILIGIMFVVSILFAVTNGLDGVRQWDDYKVEIFMFEDRFENSHFLSNMMNFWSYDIYNAAVEYVGDNTFDVVENLKENLDSDHMEYCLLIDGKEFSNMTDKKLDHSYYFKMVIGKEGILEQMMNPYRGDYFWDTPEVKGHTVEIYLGLKDEYADACYAIWNEQRLLVNSTIICMTYWSLAAIACLIYLAIVIGRDENGNKKSQGIDRMFMEVNIGLMVGTFAVCCLCIGAAISQYLYGDFSFELLKMFIQIAVVITAVLVLVLLLSLIRNMKNGTFVSRCFVAVVLKKIFGWIRKCVKGVEELASNHINLDIIGILFIYTAVIGFLGYQSMWNGIFYWFIGFCLCVLLSVFAARYLNSLQKIKKGVNKIRDGELDYKIEQVHFKDLKDLKDGINDISSGLQASVHKTLKAERMKTELITNVSHDLKTPLTSIISYTQLLSGVENLPEEARDYIAIIDKKSQRLKTLTQDLFDISKVQSGNDEIHMEKLNVETLLSQSLAEYENEFSNLTLCTKIEEGLCIRSDGRKMSRVINNLLDNVIKYSLPNTRVYINAYKKEKKVFLEIKNISSYALDFDKEEIMQRFKRGDESRTEEGHGLGLAIVKSYVEVTGGRFDIVLDGDLFKAVLEYDCI